VLNLLAIASLLLSAADHWTTYLCLRTPVEGWLVSEANPISEWLFQTLGLVPGLMIDSVVTVIAVVFLVTTSLLPRVVKTVFFVFVIGWTAYAVMNNLEAIRSLGLSPLGALA
jgi:uncharacterized protein YacL